ncbi:MAG: septum formation initiator family protein [Defluviitaleaceae bacterium]|nr:septum formation initiator family protein [Defluviitaleaceae bacterium]
MDRNKTYNIAKHRRRMQKRKNAKTTIQLAVLTGMLVFGVINATAAIRRIEDGWNEIEALEAALEAAHQETRDINSEMEHSRTEEFYENIARRNLGMVRPNEIIFRVRE